ncbi:MAG: arginine--tRNA ligase [Gammaproteobacteria bacterium]|nr:arginine--tRNA ligase [Gammaproteobacteria bacterium]MDP2141149.1 arginine--tRNA ligase [Gammaproteobacteria bacterium]MDP2349177.1 arginine--tRNA ligase [Gammaproteobacteria bacterium]
MSNIRISLDCLISEAISKVTGLHDCKAHVIYSTRPEFGDYQANGVMAAAKQLKTNPRELALRVVAAIPANDLIADVQVAGPGFINLYLSDGYLAKNASRLVATGGELLSKVETPLRVVVDYSGPNLAKEMHVGHLRGTIIGDCIARVIGAQGHQVIRQNHVGDWGTQFGMLIAHMESLRENSSQAVVQLADLESFYRKAKTRFDLEPGFADQARGYVVRLQQGDADCLRAWQQFIDESLSHCEGIYERLGVLLTREDLKPESFYNSELEDIIKVLDDKGLLSVSEGAKCVFLQEFTGKEGAPLPTIVQKSDGGFLYATTDLAALRYRGQTLGADRVLYVVDARQSLHFQQVFAIARKAEFVPPECSVEHIAYGTMMGEDGKPFKTRSGDTVKLSELLEESVRLAHKLVSAKNPDLSEEARKEISDVIGISAVKYADLSKNRMSDYVFDWSTMLSFEGNTAPYMLYAYARIRSILRKQGDEKEPSGVAEIRITGSEERNLVLKILQFPEVINQVAAECYPNYLCAYLYELAGIFMRFYEACPVLKAEAEIRASRLTLVALTSTALKQGLALLGLKTLEQM